jgi:acyl-CoA synthetase (AMP-forming)/AMP-acid ligase II
MRNCPSWILTYMGIVKAGAVATLLNGWWQAHEMEHAILLTDPKLLIADAPRAKRIAERCVDRDILGIAVDLPVEQALDDLLGDSEQVLPSVAPEDDATILFTSGSTGLCKGALSTHRAVTAGTYSYSAGLIVLLGLLTQEGRAPPTPARTLVSVPLFHVTGEVPVMLNSFVIGRCMVIMPKWDAAESLRLIEKEKITYFVGVPTMSLELMNHPDRHKYDLSSLKDITAGGGPRPVSHVARLKEEFPDAQPALGYGLTETNAVGCINFWGNYAAKPGSTGRASPFVEVAILGDGDRHLPPEEIGEIGIRSAASIEGYWRDPQATGALFTSDHFVRTGDVGYLDDDGYLFIVDRKKDIIIRGGENIACLEVEQALYAHPGVAEACVFGVPDAKYGEVPAAVFLARDGHVLDCEMLREFVACRIAAFKVPAMVWQWQSALPRLGTEKIDRKALRETYADRAYADKSSGAKGDG